MGWGGFKSQTVTKFTNGQTGWLVFVLFCVLTPHASFLGYFHKINDIRQDIILIADLQMAGTCDVWMKQGSSRMDGISGFLQLLCELVLPHNFAPFY